MKNNFKLFALSGLLFLAGLAACKKDEIATEIGGIDIDNYDLVQITDANRNLPVSIEVSGNDGIDSVTVRVFKDGATTPVTMQTIKRFTDNQFGRINLPVSFPVPSVAPNGVYKVVYTVFDKKGKSVTKDYLVNVLNNQTTKYCTFENKPLPAGTNTWVRVISTLPLGADDKVYFTGNFEEANGGTANWTGGRDLFIMNRVSENCFELAVNLTTDNEFKFTLGSWDKECFDNVGRPTSNFKWKGGSSQEYTIYNWKTKDVVIQDIPQPLPAEGISSGEVSVIADINTTDDAHKYYLVKRGASVSDKSNLMYRVPGTTKVMGSVPKDLTSEYIVVRDDEKKGVSLWGFETFITKWDGKTNPVNASVPFFEGDPAILVPPGELYIVGDATPGQWNNPVPTPSQAFTKVSDGVFELAIALNANKSYLLLPVNGSWDNKYGGTEKLGGKLLANNQVPGSNTPSPDEVGTYKITVDFTKGSYTVVKQP
jgi:hypothetical protein